MSDRIQATESATHQYWAVIDTNARGITRKHEPVLGAVYDLSAEKSTKMPKAHAVAFLRDPAFKVLDENGEVQIPLPEVEALDARKARPADLEPGQTIARFEELTDTALLARVLVRPGGHAIKPSSREAMIDFLMGAPLKAELPASERLRVSEMADPDMMPDRQAARMLGSGAPEVGRAQGGAADLLQMDG
jgi:hypothetical protein